MGSGSIGIGSTAVSIASQMPAQFCRPLHSASRRVVTEQCDRWWITL